MPLLPLLPLLPVPEPIPTIVPGLPAKATAPYSQIFNGGTLIIDAPGIYSDNFFARNTPGNSIDIAGVESTFTGSLFGSGEMNFINSGQGGRLDLSGVTFLNGPITIAPGAHVAANGYIFSSAGLKVVGGGKLSGEGLLGNTTIAADGILAPGNSIGELVVFGDFAFQDGIYEMELQGGRNDRVLVFGNVRDFNGRVRFLPHGGATAFPEFPYVGLRAYQAESFVQEGPLELDASSLPPSVVLQKGTKLVANVAPSQGGLYRQLEFRFQPRHSSGAVAAALRATGADNANVLRGATVFDQAFRRLAEANDGIPFLGTIGSPIGSTGFTTGQAVAAGLTPGFVQVQASLLALTTPAQLRTAVQAISPENYAAFQSVALNALHLQRETILSQANSCPHNGWIVNDREPNKPARQPLCVFATGGNTTASIDGSGGRSSYDSAMAAGLYGIEWKTAPAWTLGAAYGYGTANLSNLGVANSSVHSIVNTGTLYGAYTPNADWSLKGMVAYSTFALDGERSTPYLGNGNPITGGTTGQGYTTGIRVERNLPLNPASSAIPLTLKPMVGLAYGAYQQKSFSEGGNDSLQLDVAQHTAQSFVGSVGAALASRIQLNAKGTTILIPRLDLAYQVDALANETSNTSLKAELPASGVGFTTSGQSNGANNLLVGGSLEVHIADKAALFARANYQVFDHGDQFSYGGGVKYNF